MWEDNPWEYRHYVIYQHDRVFGALYYGDLPQSIIDELTNPKRSVKGAYKVWMHYRRLHAPVWAVAKLYRVTENEFCENGVNEMRIQKWLKRLL